MPPIPLISLRPVTRDTVPDICKLKVGPEQEKLVAPNAFSIAQAYFHPEIWFCAIYAADTPVGFAMLEDWSQVPGSTPQLYQGEPCVSLWRFVVNAQHQKQGYGEEVLRLLIAHAHGRARKCLKGCTPAVLHTLLYAKVTANLHQSRNFVILSNTLLPELLNREI